MSLSKESLIKNLKTNTGYTESGSEEETSRLPAQSVSRPKNAMCDIDKELIFPCNGEGRGRD